jgi:hypothetical protein
MQVKKKKKKIVNTYKCELPGTQQARYFNVHDKMTMLSTPTYIL